MAPLRLSSLLRHVGRGVVGLSARPGELARGTGALSKFREALSHQLVAFAERARRELLATGETVRKRGVGTIFDLTPQEAQISASGPCRAIGPRDQHEIVPQPAHHRTAPAQGVHQARDQFSPPAPWSASGDRPGSPDGLAPDLERPRERPFPAPGSAGSGPQAVGIGTGPLGVGGPAHGHCLGSGPRPMVRLNHEESTCECPIVQKAYRPGDGQRQ